MPNAGGSLTAVVVSGGKQYRVAPGDRVVVDRLSAAAGDELTLDSILMVADGDGIRVAGQLDGVTVTAKVVGDVRGKKIDVLRYKSKKRVRVHRGARADLTALEILTVDGQGPDEEARKSSRTGSRKPAKAAGRPEAKAKAAGKPRAVASAGTKAVKAEAEPDDAQEDGDGA